MLGLMKYVLCDKDDAGIAMMTAFRKQIAHTSLEYASFSRASNINWHGSRLGFLNPLARLCDNGFSNPTLEGMEVRSLKHHRIPSLNRFSVQRELSFCRKRTQNVDLPDPVVSTTIQVNGFLNLTSALIALVKWRSGHATCLFVPGRNGRIIVSLTPLKKWYSIDLILGFCHYVYTRTIALLSFDFCSERTATVLLECLFKTKFLIVSKFTSWDAL